MKQVTIVTGLAYGDEGKGTTVDTLARRLPSPPVVVRHNGGSQAAHNVVLPDGREHTFSQWGSGTFAGAKTHLSKHMLINPLNMLHEAEHLRSVGVSEPFESLTVAASAPIITPYHVALNRIRELDRGEGRHGSCGEGIGELQRCMREGVMPTIRAIDLYDHTTLGDKLWRIRHLSWEQALQFKPEHVIQYDCFGPNTFSSLLNKYTDLSHLINVVPNDFVQQLLEEGKSLIFEGAQGVLLDECYGFHPYTTWSNTTTSNAFDLLGDDFDADKVLSLGVIRAYGTRHGPGPFVTESPFWQPREPHNGEGEWQGSFRTGWFDGPAFKYAIAVAGRIDGVVVTHVDTIQQCRAFPVCIGYEWPNRFSIGAFTTPEIKLNPNLPGDEDFLDWQGKLTQEIMAAEPVYETRDWQAFATSEYLDMVPLYMKSCGPTYQDKVFHE